MTPTSARPNRLRNTSEAWLRSIVVALLTAFFLVFFLIPILVAFLGSFYQWNPLINRMRFIGLQNWSTMLNSALFWSALKNTALFAIVAVAARVIIGLALSLALFSRLCRAKSLFRLLYYMPTITPMVAVAFVWKFMYDPRFGLINQVLGTSINWLFNGRYAMLAILLLTIWKDFGYAVVILLGGLHSLPKETFEAAEMDGAGPLARLRYIMLPLLQPTLFFVVITSLIAYFQTYIPVLVLTQGGPGTRTYMASYIIYDQGFVKYNFGYASAISFVLFFVIALLTTFSFRLSGMGKSREDLGT